MDPGTIITVSQIAYESATQAVNFVLTAVHFPKECEELFVMLKLELFRLQLWGRSAGLEQGELLKALHPIFSEIESTLNRIWALFKDLSSLRDKIGIVPTKVEDIGQDQMRLANIWKEEMRKQGVVSMIGQQPDNDDTASLASNIRQSSVSAASFKVDVPARLRWALRDKSKFTHSVTGLEKYNNKLHQLLPYNQSLQYQRDRTRANIIIVGTATDHNTVALLGRAIEESTGAESALRNLVDRKSVATAPNLARFLRGNPNLDKNAFSLANGSRDKSRSIATQKTTGEQVLLEKKPWDDEQSLANHHVLQMRLKRLVAMLGPGKSDYLLQALGFAKDEERKCWWIVYKIPPAIVTTDTCQVLTLHECLRRKDSYSTAPLEYRTKLAFRLASAYSELFSSGWVHKAISSRNIIYFGPEFDVTNPLIGGFEFSRQETEGSNVDAAKTQTEIERNMYQHPDYVNNEATRYISLYDFYSFGLVLLEIAYWQPLEALHGLPKGNTFRKQDAQTIHAFAMEMVAKELPFRIGTLYANAVGWCLKNSTGQDEDDWHPALAFNDHVVVPLSGL